MPKTRPLLISEALNYYLFHRRKLFDGLTRMEPDGISERSPQHSDAGTKEDPSQVWNADETELLAKYWIEFDDDGEALTFATEVNPRIRSAFDVAQKLALN